jgi:hypothetical protein
MAEVTQRAATLTDMKNIWALVRQTAADFPVDLSTDAGQEYMLSEIMIGCSSDLSPVAVGKDKAIVGALLARRDENEWGLWNGNVIHVTHAAVAPSQKDQGLLQSLFVELQGKKMPIHVSVKSGNAALADEIKKLGFEVAVTAADGWGDLYVWDPPAAANGAANGAAAAAA